MLPGCQATSKPSQSYITHDNYYILNATKYSIEINYKITHFDQDPQVYYIKSPRIQDHEIYQDVTSFAYGIWTPNMTRLEFVDQFGNLFDNVNATLNYGESFNLRYVYEIVQNEIQFKDLTSAAVGSYSSIPDYIRALYLDLEDQYYETWDHDLIGLSNALVEGLDHPIDKAKAIHDYVAEKIEYEVQDSEMGALWTYQNRKGDCSDYSDLMITLLRIQGIPARKICGPMYADWLNPQVNDSWNYYLNYDHTTQNATSNLMGHAWVEYYVPNIGWVVADPTWSENSSQYFNYIDTIHFFTMNGAWFSFPVIEKKYSEGFITPGFVTSIYSIYDSQYTVSVKTLDVGLETAQIPEETPDDNNQEDDDPTDNSFNLYDGVITPIETGTTIFIGLILFVVIILLAFFYGDISEAKDMRKRLTQERKQYYSAEPETRSVSKPEALMKFCPYCGESVNPNDIHCAMCGEKIGTREIEKSVPPQVKPVITTAVRTPRRKIRVKINQQKITDFTVKCSLLWTKIGFYWLTAKHFLIKKGALLNVRLTHFKRHFKSDAREFLNRQNMKIQAYQTRQYQKMALKRAEKFGIKEKKNDVFKDIKKKMREWKYSR